MDGAGREQVVDPAAMGGMGHVVMVNPWTQLASASPGVHHLHQQQQQQQQQQDTSSLYRYPAPAVPWTHYYQHPAVAYPANGALIDGDFFTSSADCVNLFELQGDFLTPVACQQQTSDESLYPGQSSPPPQPSPASINWTLPYGPDEDKLRQMCFVADGDLIRTLPYGLEQQQQHVYYHNYQYQQQAPPVTSTSRSGIRVKFIGPEEIGVSQRQRGARPVAQPLPVHTPTPPVLPQQTSFSGGLDDDVVEVEVSTSASQGPGTERVTFNSIEEALASIETQSLANEAESGSTQQASLAAHQHPMQGLRAVHTTPPALRVADEKQEEVIKAAKSLFSKRTRTLYHWLYPDTSKTKLKATVSAAWDTLADTEKQFYLSQVLGRFGLQASSLMINPQLDGIKGLPAAPASPSSPGYPATATAVALGATSRTATAGAGAAAPASSGQTHRLRSHPHQISEAQQAVDQLFASCEDSDTWTSFDINPPCHPCPYPSPSPGSSSIAAPATSTRQSKRRKRTRSRLTQLGMLASEPLDEEVNILKRMREAKLEAELEDDAELSSELQKFRLVAQDGDRSVSCRDGDEFWRRTPDPEDIFTQLNF